MGESKRLLPRVRRRLGVTMAGARAFTADISPGGFCIETMTVQRAGSDVNGVLQLDGREFSFTGKVAWAVAGDLRALQRGRMGIRFTGVASDYYQLFG